MRTVLRALLALALLASVALVGAPASNAAPDNRPTFIVTLKSGEPRAVAAEHASRHGAEVTFVYEHALRGYAAKVSEGQIGALARDGRVARVERDGVVQASETTQSNATWGLDRIDARSGLDQKYTYKATGAGVTAYIIDTGILNSHNDFGGRAFDGYDAVSNDDVTEDCNGHGTHVAGTVGGTTYGVAKMVKLVGVRVLDCAGSGTWSGVIAGVDWVTKNAVKPAVANMSLGGGGSSSVDTAVKNSIASGVSYAVAAGNAKADACNYSPARVGEAMTIGATTSTDARASYSNYGSCVDWFAPGSSITSAWHTGNTVTNTISGTSMATPHVAGAAALYLQGNPQATAMQVRDALYALTTNGKVSSSSSTNNHLLYTLDIGGTTVTPPSASAITLSVKPNSRRLTAELSWTGASTGNVDIHRNDQPLTNTANDGLYKDSVPARGTYTYQVCESGSLTACSPKVTVTF